MAQDGRQFVDENMVAEYDGSGNLTICYFFGTGTDEPLAEASGNLLDCTAAKFLHANSQGSIIARADCSGNIVNRNTYDEWGIPGSGNAGRFQYTGQMWMPELGMYYYKARMYSPTLGRFMQTDPVGYQGGLNLYAYAGNDPIDGRDPSGKATMLDATICERAPALCSSRSTTQYSITISTEKGDRSAALTEGHSWITLTKTILQKDGTTKTETMTKGLWADGYAKSNGAGHDIRTNLELNRTSDVSRTKEISAQAYDNVIKDSSRNITYNPVSDNCATFASREWLVGTGEGLSARNMFGIDTPFRLSNSISNANNNN